MEWGNLCSEVHDEVSELRRFWKCTRFWGVLLMIGGCCWWCCMEGGRRFAAKVGR